MNNLFAQSRSHWVRYDRYEIKTGKDGKRYITPEKAAKPDIYNPLKESSEMVLEALNVGMLMMNRRSEDVVEKAILAFVNHYGLLGLMTALSTTPSFMDYEAVYLPKNHFIKEESMATEDYLALFYPFDKLDVVKKGVESSWNVSGDNMMIALTMTFMDEPMAKNMSFQREYAEPYDWVAQQFKDWAFTLTTSVLYYNDYDSIDEDTRNLYRKAMAAFGGIAPLSYRTAGETDHLLGLPFVAAGHPDDVQLYAGGRCKAPAAVQALPEGVPRQPGQFRILQRPVQESV